MRVCGINFSCAQGIEGNKRENDRSGRQHRMPSGFGCTLSSTLRFGLAEIPTDSEWSHRAVPLLLSPFFLPGNQGYHRQPRSRDVILKCSVGSTLTNPSGERKFWPRALDTQAVFGLGPWVGIYEKRLDQLGFSFQSRRRPLLRYCSFSGGSRPWTFLSCKRLFVLQVVYQVK